MKRHYLLLTFIGCLTVASGSLLAVSRTDYRVGLDSVVEIWADFVRDVDRVGLTMTRISAQREVELGREIERRIFINQVLKDDPELQAYVTSVGQTLLPHIQRKAIGYRFFVINSPKTAAFALPGGGIHITTGMLGFLQSESELAAILAHEISHVDLRHCIERLQYELVAKKIVGRNLAMIARIGYSLVQVGFSEQQELEADAGGAILAAKAGYDPRAAEATFERLLELEPRNSKEKPVLMIEELGIAIGKALEQYRATHPPTAKRIQRLRRVFRSHAKEWRNLKFYVGRSNYSDRIPRSLDDRPDEWKHYSLTELS